MHILRLYKEYIADNTGIIYLLYIVRYIYIYIVLGYYKKIVQRSEILTTKPLKTWDVNEWIEPQSQLFMQRFIIYTKYTLIEYIIHGYYIGVL